MRDKQKSRQHGRAKPEAIRLELEQLDERMLPSASPFLGTLSHAAKGDNHHALVSSGTHQTSAHNAARTRAATTESNDGTDGEVADGTGNDQVQDGPGDTADHKSADSLRVNAVMAVPGERGAMGRHPNAKARAPRIDPTNFVSTIDNPFSPMKPGTNFFYEGVKDGVPTTNEIVVTHDTKVILGVTTTVVHDRAFEDGVLVEDTIDWFAQDRRGNVWYFGEDTKKLDANGNVISTEGSFEGGVNGAFPGIIMEGHPRVGDRYRQEVAPGVAEDRAAVLRLNREKCVQYGCFDHLLLTEETTRLNPGDVEHKFYARGVGFILGVSVPGGAEHTELVRITTEGG